MKLTKVEHFSKAAPGFNKVAAKQVYDAIMACPDDESANIMKRAIVFDAMCRDIYRHGDFLAKAYEESELAKFDDVRQKLVQRFLTKSAAGEDVTEIKKAAGYLELIRKDTYDRYERSRNAARQRRSKSGQFAVEHTNIKYDREQPVDNHIFERLYGVKMPTHHTDKQGNELKRLSPQERRNWQLAYQNALDIVAPYSNHPGAMVHFYHPGEPDRRATPKEFIQSGKGIRTAKRPHSVAVTISDNYSLPDGVPDFYRMSGFSPSGASFQSNYASTSETGFNPDRLRRYNDANAAKLDNNRYLQPGGRLFQRMGSGSSLLQDTLGDNAPPKVLAALEAANWVGDFGPEAQRVLGPTVQRTSYRYRGVEKPPDKKVVDATKQALAATARSESPTVVAAHTKLREVYNRGAKKIPGEPLKPMARYERRFNVEAQLSRLSDPVKDERGQEKATSLIGYFKHRLPDANLNTLQRKSGTIPPSEGIILDKHGKVITQAIGYGDDWYLPFNLKNVNRMRGGAYIRTRTFGGPTTEDIYTALISGARSLTVVSWNGVYTVQFDKSFKGGRRYNDKAARMVARYGQILDAVNSNKVILDTMDPARVSELHEESVKNVRNPENPEEVKDEFQRLMQKERVDPKISARRDEEIKNEVIYDNIEASAGRGGKDLAPEDVRNRLVNQYRLSGASDEDVAILRGKLQTNDGMIAALQLGQRLETARTRERAKYRREMSPLSLNGQGYKLALDALQEQFPYYIEKPTWHEWEERGKGDTGYVKPKHLRPADVWAGYFDESILGYKKVHADSVARMDYKPVSETDLNNGQRPLGGGTTSSSGGGGGSSAGGTARPDVSPSSSPTPEDVPDIVKVQADRELAEHLIKWANSTDGDIVINGQPLKTGPQNWLRNKAAPDPIQQKITAITGMSTQDVEDELEKDPEAFHRKLMEATNTLDSQKFYSPPKDLWERARLRGALPPARRIDMKDPSRALSRPNDEYELGRNFEPGRQHTTDGLLTTFRDDPDIKTTGLPEPTADGFDKQWKEKISAVDKEYSTISARRRRGTFTIQDEKDLTSRTLGLIKAAHIKRRLGEVEEPTAPTAASSAATPGTQVSVHFDDGSGLNQLLTTLGLKPKEVVHHVETGGATATFNEDDISGGMSQLMSDIDDYRKKNSTGGAGAAP